MVQTGAQKNVYQVAAPIQGYPSVPEPTLSAEERILLSLMEQERILLEDYGPDYFQIRHLRARIKAVEDFISQKKLRSAQQKTYAPSAPSGTLGNQLVEIKVKVDVPEIKVPPINVNMVAPATVPPTAQLIYPSGGRKPPESGTSQGADAPRSGKPAVLPMVVSADRVAPSQKIPLLGKPIETAAATGNIRQISFEQQQGAEESGLAVKIDASEPPTLTSVTTSDHVDRKPATPVESVEPETARVPSSSPQGADARRSGGDAPYTTSEAKPVAAPAVPAHAENFLWRLARWCVLAVGGSLVLIPLFGVGWLIHRFVSSAACGVASSDATPQAVDGTPPTASGGTPVPPAFELGPTYAEILQRQQQETEQQQQAILREIFQHNLSLRQQIDQLKTESPGTPLAA